MSIKKVLLLGGTGAIGTYLRDILNDKGVEVYVTSRSMHKDKGHIHFIQCNAKENIELNKVCFEHWNAIVDFLSYKTDELSRRLKVMLNSTDQYIFLSSARVFANEEHPIKPKIRKKSR